MAYDCYKRNDYSGVGVILTNGLCGIDIDAHNGGTNPNAESVISMFNDTYIEKSPSGTGYHILFYCDIERLPIVKDIQGKPMLDKNGKYMLDGYGFRNDKQGLEIYFSGITNRYFTFTGNTINNKDVVDMTDVATRFLKTYMDTEHRDEDVSSDIPSEIIEKARRASNGKKFKALFDDGDLSFYSYDHSRADLALCSMLAYWCKGNTELIDACFRQSALCRDKWTSREDYREWTLYKASKNQIKPYEAYTSEEGKAVITIDALDAWLTKKGISIRYNEITHETEYEGVEKCFNRTTCQQDNIAVLIHDSLKSEMKCTLTDIVNYMKVIAESNSYNPFHVYLAEQPEWDKIDRVEELYDIMHISREDTISRTLIHKFLRQVYALSFNQLDDPFGADGILVLQGKQGSGKTQLCSKLGINSKLGKQGLYIDTRDKDTIIRGTACLIGELGEIGCTMKSDIDRLKSFITMDVDRYRVPYGRADNVVVRKTSFIATTNDDQFIVDGTGARRFWTIPLSDERFDFEKLNNLDVGQLWKQIEAEVGKYPYSTEFGSSFQNSFRLTSKEQSMLAERNSTKVKMVKGQQEVMDIILMANECPDDYDWQYLTTTQWKQRYDCFKNYSSADLGRALNAIGIKDCAKRIDGKCRNGVRELPVPKRWVA